MKYRLIDICGKMLDNANMALDLSLYPSVNLNFVVHGLVNKKFWEVRFQCEETIRLKMENENDISSRDLYAVFEVNVTGKTMEDISEDLKLSINDSKPENVWFINIYGDVPIEIVCCKFSWQLVEMTQQQYESKCV